MVGLNGAAGVVVTAEGRPVSIMGFTVTDGKIVEIDSLVDPERLAQLDLTIGQLPRDHLQRRSRMADCKRGLVRQPHLVP
jgi:hypothetical protein